MILARLPWYLAGPLIGLLMIGLRATLNKPFGALGGYIDLAENALTPGRLGFRAYVLFGLVLGGALYAVLSGAIAPSLAYGTAGGLLPTELPTQFAILLGAGLVMGYGARMAGGCTSGHGMSGMSLMSPASIVATATFFAAAVLLVNALQLVAGVSS
jgi:uncharacterized membrane protein YedE/YeeE